MRKSRKNPLSSNLITPSQLCESPFLGLKIDSQNVNAISSVEQITEVNQNISTSYTTVTFNDKSVCEDLVNNFFHLSKALERVILYTNAHYLDESYLFFINEETGDQGIEIDYTSTGAKSKEIRIFAYGVAGIKALFTKKALSAIVTEFAQTQNLDGATVDSRGLNLIKSYLNNNLRSKRSVLQHVTLDKGQPTETPITQEIVDDAVQELSESQEQTQGELDLQLTNVLKSEKPSLPNRRLEARKRAAKKAPATSKKLATGNISFEQVGGVLANYRVNKAAQDNTATIAQLLFSKIDGFLRHEDIFAAIKFTVQDAKAQSVTHTDKSISVAIAPSSTINSVLENVIDACVDIWEAQDFDFDPDDVDYTDFA